MHKTAGTFAAPFPGLATVREETGPAPPAYFSVIFFFLCSVYFLVKMNCNLFLMSTTSFLDLIFIIVLDTVLGVSCYYLSLLVFLWEIFLRALGTQSWTLYMVYLHWYLLVLNGTAPSTFFSLRYFNTDLLWKIKLYIWPCGCL